MSTAESLETTRDLVAKIQGGDQAACNRLLARYGPILTRWAHGLLPKHARDLNETADLVQLTLMRAFKNLPAFDNKGDGAFFGYLRHVLVNLVRDELRHSGRRPVHEELVSKDGASEHLFDSNPSPEAQAIGAQSLVAYERALRALDQDDRDLVIMRVELGLSNEEIASATTTKSVNAARMRLARALVRLAELMHEYRA